MNENGKQQAMHAGKAYMAAIESDPNAKQALARALTKLQVFAHGVTSVGPSQDDAMKLLCRVFGVFDEAAKAAQTELRRTVRCGTSDLRAEQQRAFEELANEIDQSLDAVKTELASHGFEAPGDDLEAWADLARLVEKEPGPMTIEEIYRWAIAWAKRQVLQSKLARGEKSAQETSDDKGSHDDMTSAEDASIRRDEHDDRIVWCVGKRVYVGNDTQISRLFWLLASPLGRARSLWEVQRAVDGFETDRDQDTSGDEFERSRQRIRKILSKLRGKLRSAGADDHVLITRGGDEKDPEYTMMLRFGKNR